MKEMTAQIELARGEVKESSQSANAHSRALVLVTKWSAGLTAVYVVLMAGILWMTSNQIQVAKDALQVNVEPELVMEVVTTTQEGTRLILKNEGTYSLVDLSVDVDLIGFVGPPFNQKVSHIRRIFETVGSPWWKIEELKAGKTETQDLEELGKEALGHIPFTKSSMERGHLPGILPDSSAQIMSAVKFTLFARRPVDRKRYRQEIFPIVLQHAKTGEPRFVDPRFFSYYEDLKEAIIDK